MDDNRTHAATNTARPQALEFFAGIGLARLGLEEAGFQVERHRRRQVRNVSQ